MSNEGETLNDLLRFGAVTIGLVAALLGIFQKLKTKRQKEAFFRELIGWAALACAVLAILVLFFYAKQIVGVYLFFAGAVLASIDYSRRSSPPSRGEILNLVIWWTFAAMITSLVLTSTIVDLLQHMANAMEVLTDKK